MSWDQEAAILFCQLIEPIANQCGAHVALTGGCLYKEGIRKDLDIMFYRHKDNEEINLLKLHHLCYDFGLKWIIKAGRVHKAEFMSRGVDMFFPQEPQYQDKEYPTKNKIKIGIFRKA